MKHINTHLDITALFVVFIATVYLSFQHFQHIPNPTETTKIEPTYTTFIRDDNPGEDASRRLLAGLDTVYDTYILTLPEDWEVIHEHNAGAGLDRLLLSKTGYNLVISQLPQPSSRCYYPGDLIATPDHESFGDYEIISSDEGNLFRRSSVSNPGSPDTEYTVCQHADEVTYQFPTQFGQIQYLTPPHPDKSMLAEMDTIVASLAHAQ